MSLRLEFEPHAWYMGAAIRDNRTSGHDQSNVERPIDSADGYRYTAYIENGNTYRIDERHADTLRELREQIRAYHLGKRNGYGERIARRRLEYLRGELRAERISYGENVPEILIQSLEFAVDNLDMDNTDAINALSKLIETLKESK